MKKDILLSLIPVALGIALLLPLWDAIKHKKKGTAIALHLLISYAVLGIALAVFLYDLNLLVSDSGFCITSILTGLGIFMANQFVFQYQHKLLGIIIGAIGFGVAPFLALYLTEIKLLGSLTNIFWIFIIIWQVVLGLIMGLCARTQNAIR